MSDQRPMPVAGKNDVYGIKEGAIARLHALSSPGLTGRSSNPRPGILDRPVKPGNETMGSAARSRAKWASMPILRTGAVGQPLVHVHHEGDTKQRGCQIENRNRNERRDEQSGRENRGPMPAAQCFGLGHG